MSEESNTLGKPTEAQTAPGFSVPFPGSSEADQKIAGHRAWLKTIRHEQPSLKKHFRAGVYIRYFNQTKYENYLDYHIQQYRDTMALCPNWELVDFYIDEGANPPNMESAGEWCRLLGDCFSGRVDLIITQKVSNVSRKHYEIAMVARILAALEKPVGIYFVSENIFTLASYYQHDLKDRGFFPSEDWRPLPDDGAGEPPLLAGGETDA